MQKILTRINKIPGVRGTLIVGADGLVIASDLSGNEDPNELGAVASSVRAALTSAFTRLQHGQVKRFAMHGSVGSAVILSVGEALLLTLVRKDANMGMVLVELREAAVELANAMGI